MILNPRRLLEPAPIEELSPPLCFSIEDGEERIALLNAEIKALSLQVAPYRKVVERIYQRIASLNKRRHAIQAFLTIGITKVPHRKKGVSIPKVENVEDYLAYLLSLTPEQLNHLLETPLGESS